MNHLSPRALEAASPPAPLSSKPYVAPVLTELGSVETITSGPDNGDMDQLVGAAGGFRRDSTS